MSRRVAEVVGVVSVARGAVGDDERGLPGPAGPARPLGVVGRCRWDIAQADGVEAGDVHAELHGGGAEQERQVARAEGFLALFAHLGGDLGGVLLGLQPAEGLGHLLVERGEEGVDPNDGLGVERLAQRVLSALAPVTGDPADR